MDKSNLLKPNIAMTTVGLTWRKYLCLGLLGFGAMFTLISAIIFNVMIDAMIKYELSQKLPIKDGSYGYHFWQKPPTAVSFNMYVFNITNPDEVMKGKPPNLVEKGPYVYLMHLNKTRIEWHPNGTVSYVQVQTFKYDREASVGPETEKFNTLNIPYMTSAYILRYEYSWIQRIVSAMYRASNETVFKQLSVKDIWWGYDDPILEKAAKLVKEFNITSSFFTGKFGFYMGRNNTGDGHWNVWSGLSGNLDNYLTVDRWNGLKILDTWNSDYCNGMRGTDGSQHPPNVSPTQNLSMFDPQLERSLKMVYNGTSSYKGVRALRYVVPYSEFANATDVPENAGWCMPDIEHCLPSGIFNMTIIQGAPTFSSMPHFLGADPYYRTQVTGLKPDTLKHQPFYDVHQMTGVSLNGYQRYQIVIRTQPMEHWEDFKTFPVSYLPIMWIDGGAPMNPTDTALFKDQMQDMMDAMPYVRMGMFMLAAVLLGVFLVLLLRWTRRGRQFFRRIRGKPDEKTPLIAPEDITKPVTQSINTDTVYDVAATDPNC